MTMSNITLELLKEWHKAGAKGEEDKHRTKSKLKMLLKLDNNPTIGELLPTEYRKAQPALIFKKGTFEARLSLEAVSRFLENNWHPPRTPREWLKENLVGTRGKFLLAGKDDLYFSPIDDISAYVTDGKTIIRVLLKAPIPASFVDSKDNWGRYVQGGQLVAVVNRKELYAFVKLFIKEKSIELILEKDNIIKLKCDDKYSTIKGETELKAQTKQSCILKVNPKTLSNILKSLETQEVSLFINETCLSINGEAAMAHWKGYPQFPLTNKEALKCLK